MIDLDSLRTWHSGMPEWQAKAYASHAAIALQRRHAPGVEVRISFDGGQETSEHLTWTRQPSAAVPMVDVNRATEDGAEGVALAIVGIFRRWRLIRRLQSIHNEGADWLAETEAGQAIVLEISGTDDGPFEPRVRTKRAQAVRAAVASGASPAVSVVRFREPKAMLGGKAFHAVPERRS